MTEEKIVYIPERAKQDKEFEKSIPKEEKPKREKKLKEKPQPVKPKSMTFPAEGKVNAYAFIHLSSDIMEAWGLSKGKEQRITIDLTPDGALVIRKA